MALIDSVIPETVIDSRGKPTVMVSMSTGGVTVCAKVPSGKSAGSREALELRDEDGVGVTRACSHVSDIARSLIGTTLDSSAIDAKLIELDGTKNKSNLGANATLGISMAGVKLSAAVRNVPLWKHVAELSHSSPGRPHLYMNMLNGGAHGDFRLPFQEYIVVVGKDSMTTSYEMAQSIFSRLGLIMRDRYSDALMGDEGGFSPAIDEIERPFELLREAIGDESNTYLAIDVAASEFFRNGMYSVGKDSYTAESLGDIYASLSSRFGIKSIEDPYDESDFPAFEKLTKTLGEKVLIVGDDLTVTNPEITTEMVREKRANAMIIKPNQVGTMAEVFAVAQIAREAGWKLIASHRSGETDDAFISDLAVGIGAWGLKAGAPTQLERRVKYERLVEIEREIVGYN